MRRVLLLGLVLTACTAHVTLAQPEVWVGPPTYLHTNPTDPFSTEAHPTVATDGLGTWVAMWHRSGGPCRSFSRSTDNGATWSPHEDINQPFSCTVGTTGLATDGAGNWVAIWSDNFDGVIVSRSSNNGIGWDTPSLLISEQLTESPSVATDGSGTWLTVWSGRDRDAGANDWDLFVARSTDNGSSWEELPRLNSDADSDGSNDNDSFPELVTDGNGTWVVAWSQDNPLVNETRAVRVSRSTDDGQTWSPVTVLDSDPVVSQLPALATDGQGNWVAAWWCPTLTEVCASRSTDNGATWSSPQAIVGSVVFTWHELGLAADGLGNWVLLGSHLLPPPPNNGYELFISTSGDGVTWSAAELLDADAQRDRWPRVALDGSGNGVVVFSSFLPGSGFPLDARGSQIRLMGLEALDPNPSLLSAGDVSTDPLVLAGDGGRPVKGLAADGVTRVLVRVTTPGPGNVEFRIKDENNVAAAVGGLRTPGGVGSVTTLPVPVVPVGNRHLAFAVMIPPLTFSRSAADETESTRTINLEAEFVPDGGGPPATLTETLELHRPPVLLLHGLWSNEGAFGWDLRDDPIYSVFNGDYRQTNDSEYFVNRGCAFVATRSALQDMRDRDIAVTQLDAFGHSMGGILLRRWVAGEGFPYLRDANFNAGDLRSLVTVDTPHTGSPLANVLIGLSETPLIGGTAADNFLVLGFCITCGAVRDLQTDSAATLNMPAANLPVHAIVGKGGSDLIQAGLESQLPLKLGAMLAILRFFGILPDDIFPPGLQHDLVVGRPSQEGGLSGGHTSVFGFESVVPPVLAVHFSSIAREPPGNARAIELLNTPADESTTFAPGFAAAAPSAAAPAVTPSAFQVQLSQTGGIQITSPPAGTMITPGQPISVAVDAFGGFVPSTVLISSNYDAKYLDTPPYVADLMVPDDASGPVTLKASALDASDALAQAVDVVVQVDLSGVTLQSIPAGPETAYIFPSAATQAGSVVGTFSDGVERDVTQDSATTFVSADPTIATVDGNGNVTGIAIGQTRIDITNGALAAFVDVDVVNVPLELRVDPGGLSWPQLANAIGYDIVRGDLDTLRETGGDFTLATVECLDDDAPGTSLAYSAEPGAGQGFWFLVRAVLPGQSLSYDVEPGVSDSQVGSRDAEINAAGGSCPPGP